MELPASDSVGFAALVFVIRLEGEFDLLDVPRLRDAFAIPKSADLVVLDLQKVSYIDSNVLNCIIDLRRRTLDRHARLMLLGINSSVKRIFEICDFQRLFEIEETFVSLRRICIFDDANVRKLTLTSAASAGT